MTQLASFILWRLYNSIGESVVSGWLHKSYLKKKTFYRKLVGKMRVPGNTAAQSTEATEIWGEKR